MLHKEKQKINAFFKYKDLKQCILVYTISIN